MAAVVLLLSGCASTSVFFPYPAQAEHFRRAINAPDTDVILGKLDQQRTSADKMLYLMERARIEQLAGRFDASKTDFEAVIDAFKAGDDRATISLSGTGAAGSAILTNDNAIPYRGYAYERVLAHQFQAVNYLALNDREGAAVELRNAQLVQREAELKYEADLSKTRSEAEEKKVPVSQYDSYFTGMDTVTGTLKHSFQNGYTFYFSAVVWEALGEYNDALVDYKKALELAPDNKSLEQDVIRVNGYFDGKTKPEKDKGNIVVIFEQGFVQPKRSVSISIATTNGGWISVAFPVYDAQDHLAPSPLTVRHDNDRFQTFVLSDTSALAVKALKEQVPAMIVRQVLRARAKYEMQKQAANQGGLVAQLATNIYNLVSEQADMRSWLTLPANAQALRLTVAAGETSLELGGVAGSQSLPLRIRGGSTTLIRVVEVNGQLLVQTFAL